MYMHVLHTCICSLLNMLVAASHKKVLMYIRTYSFECIQKCMLILQVSSLIPMDWNWNVTVNHSVSVISDVIVGMMSLTRRESPY